MGFELKKQIYLERVAGQELRMDVMVREPAASKTDSTEVLSKFE